MTVNNVHEDEMKWTYKINNVDYTQVSVDKQWSIAHSAYYTKHTVPV